MPARKGVFIAVLALGGLFALILALGGRSSAPPPGKVVLHYVTTNAGGAPMALVELFLYRRVWPRFDAIDIKPIDEWQRMRYVPTNVFRQVDALCTVPKGDAHKVNWIVFPTNSNWRLRLELVQARTGFGGLVDRVFHARSHYKAGGWSNIVHGTRPVPYVGRSWRIETEEIRLP